MMVLKNALILEGNPPAVREGEDIVIQDQRIIAAGPGAGEAYPGAERLDLKGAAVSAGLVCSHNHFYSGLARGMTASIGPTPDFVSVLKNQWWVLDRAIDEPILEYSALASLLEAVKAGTTAVVDHHASPALIDGSLDILKKAFERIGVRGILCYETTDRHGAEDMRRGVDENVRLAKRVDQDRRQNPYSLVEAALGGHAPFTLPDQGLELLAQAAEETGRGFHCHAGEGGYDVSHSHLTYGRDIAERLDSFGLLGPKSLMVHGVHLSGEEIDRLAARESFLIHNPRSNMNNGVGYNRYLGRMEEGGGAVALGTDGIGSNMFETFKTAFFKAQEEGAGAGPGDVLRRLWQGNTLLERYFGQTFGRIAEGATADLVIYDYHAPTPLTGENLGGHLAFGFSSRDVRSVIINGQFVYKDRAFPFDPEPIYRRAREEARRLWQRMETL